MDGIFAMSRERGKPFFSALDFSIFFIFHPFKRLFFIAFPKKIMVSKKMLKINLHFLISFI